MYAISLDVWAKVFDLNNVDVLFHGKRFVETVLGEMRRCQYEVY